MTTPPQSERDALRAPLLKWVAASCHISTCSFERTKYGTAIVHDCDCGLEDARAALAIEPAPEPQPAGSFTIKTNKLTTKGVIQPGGEIQPEPERLSGKEIATIVGVLSENEFETGFILRTAIHLQARCPEPQTPPPAVLTAADALAETLRKSHCSVCGLDYSDRGKRMACDCDEIVDALAAYKAARSNGEGKADAKS